ncbi:MAG: hypothetical protein NVSMB55_13130 [Mycobacteriales bacterium]
MEPSALPICTIGPSRPTDPPAPMHRAEANAFTAATDAGIRPPFFDTAYITSGTPCPRACGANRDQRAVDEARENRQDQHDPAAEPGQVRVTGATGGAVVVVSGQQPGDAHDQVPEADRTDASADADA